VLQVSYLVGCLVGQCMVGCETPWLGRYWGVVYGGRDIDVVSMVLTLGWEGCAWVCGGSMFDVTSFFFGVIFLSTRTHTLEEKKTPLKAITPK